MRKKIYINLIIISAISLLISIIVGTFIVYINVYNQNERLLKVNAEYILHSNKYISKDIRVTYINKDGKVTYDNKKDAKLLDNHKNRKEIKEASIKNESVVLRKSDTLHSNNMYYTIKLDNGNFLRVSNSLSSILFVILSILPYSIFLNLIIFIIIIILSRNLSKSIVAPINNINLDSPLDNVIYDELSPVLRKIYKQNKKLKSKIEEIDELKILVDNITNNMEEPLIILNEELYIEYSNKAFATLFNKKIEKEYILKYLNVNPIENNKITIGNKIYQLLKINIKNDKNIIIFVDISEKEMLENMRIEFSSNVSHELKTPLTSILGYSELLTNEIITGKDVKEVSHKINSQAKELLELIDDIIQISKLENNNIKIEKELININDIFIKEIEKMKIKANIKNIEIIFNEKQELFINVYTSIIKEIIHNLISNAIKYNIENGIIKIDIIDNGFSIENTGIQLNEEELTRIFERFYRVDKSRYKNIPGTGLGLAIVKHGVKLHGGNIKVENTDIGVKFTVLLS